MLSPLSETLSLQQPQQFCAIVRLSPMKLQQCPFNVDLLKPCKECASYPLWCCLYQICMNATSMLIFLPTMPFKQKALNRSNSNKTFENVLRPSLVPCIRWQQRRRYQNSNYRVAALRQAIARLSRRIYATQTRIFKHYCS